MTRMRSLWSIACRNEVKGTSIGAVASGPWGWDGSSASDPAVSPRGVEHENHRVDFYGLKMHGHLWLL